jgi:putative thiamine transport system permease protein
MWRLRSDRMVRLTLWCVTVASRVRLARLAPPLLLAILWGLCLRAGRNRATRLWLSARAGWRAFYHGAFQCARWQPGIARSALLSILIGLVTTLVSLGTVAAFVASDLGTATFSRVRRLISPLLSVPHAAAAFGLAFMIAPSGMIMRLISPWATGLDRPPDVLIVNDPMALSMMAGLIVKEIPFLFLVTLAALPQTRHSETMRLGRSLGYGRIASFTFCCGRRSTGRSGSRCSPWWPMRHRWWMWR